MVQWVNRLRNSIIVNPLLLPLLLTIVDRASIQIRRSGFRDLFLLLTMDAQSVIQLHTYVTFHT